MTSTVLSAKRLAMVLFVVVVCLATGPGRAWACSCVQPGTPAEELAKSTAVFTGRVVDVHTPTSEVISSADPVQVTFQVYSVWKGPVNEQLVVTTARESASCGYAFSQGLEYLVYAYGSESELAADICSRSRSLSGADGDLAALGHGTDPAAGQLDQPTVPPVGPSPQPAQEGSFGGLLPLAGGLAIQMVIVAAVVVLGTRVKKPALKILVWAVALYLFLGFLYSAVGLYCYNTRNWEFYGGLSVPPLFCPMGIFDLLMWPVYVWANLINGFGVFGNCGPPLLQAIAGG
jgi:hypothetical protein